MLCSRSLSPSVAVTYDEKMILRKVRCAAFQADKAREESTVRKFTKFTAIYIFREITNFGEYGTSKAPYLEIL